MLTKRALILISLLILFLTTAPIFFDIYRMAAFSTEPRDDYAPYLLALVGQGQETPEAPLAYRVISVVIAIPFYFFAPTYTFTNLPNVDIAYLKATQALSLSSYFSLVLTPVVLFKLTRRQRSATAASALIVALLSFFMSGFISREGVDPFAVLIISVLLFVIGRPGLFIPLIIASIGINEKIPIIFAALFVARFLVSLRQPHRFTQYPQLISSCLALVGYFALVSILRIPGNETQMNPALFPAHLKSSLLYSLSLKGLFLNQIPVLILLSIIFLAIGFRARTGFQPADAAAFAVILLLAAIADVVFNIGRVVMFSYPLYLPAVSAFVDYALDTGRNNSQPNEALV